MEKYELYKPSGVEWIGEIPVHWSISRLKYNIQSNLSYGVLKPDKYFEEDSIPIVRTVDISDSYDISKFDRISPKVSNEYKRTIIQEGDVLISVVGTIGKTMIVTKELEGCNLSRSVCRIVLNGSLNNKFLNYLFNSEVFLVRVFELTSGSIQSVLNLEDLSTFVFPYPFINEQLQIVQFLDEKTELIDRLISIKERKISLLKEQRISIINQVITKGLNHKIKMKDSGVEWIGEIPEGWIVNKLGRIVNTKQGIQVDYEQQKFIKEEGYIRFLRISDYTKFDEEPRYVLVTNSINYLVNVDDIVMFRYGDSGKVVRGIEGLICNNLFTIKTKNNQIENNYLYTVLSSDIVYQQLRNSSDNPTLKQVSHTILNNFFITIPPLQEQLQIVQFLDLKTKEIDDLVQLEQKKIDLLKEYRQSLISEVVTGKIKVTTDE
jgi:type I restriction enzyme S subunit